MAGANGSTRKSRAAEASAPAPASEPRAGTTAESAGFVHLHLHSEYSLLDGGNRLDRLVSRVKELGMDAVAVTDHGNLFGAVAFYQEAREAGIKPILGVEAYVTPPGKPRSDRTYSGGGEGGYHTVLLAETNEGWSNLLVLCSEAFLTGFYYKPRIDRELLAAHSRGLIAINGHLGSEIGDHLLDFERSGDRKFWELAVESARWHDQVFNAEHRASGAPARFFVELQHHVPEQNGINRHLIRLAGELDVPLVCDNDAHFLRAEDHDSHDTLICISTARNKKDASRLHYPPELYVKSPAQMRGMFVEHYGEIGAAACDRTVEIARRCNVELPLGKNHAPMVRVEIARNLDGSLPAPDDPEFQGDIDAWHAAFCRRFEVVPFSSTPTPEELALAKPEVDRALRLLAEAGFVWRYGAGEADGQKRARLERELSILCGKNISAYFLIVWDFVNWGRQRGIPSNARGSGVGTMVGYVLGLSNACPVRYGLLFERFTDPDRSEFPDIDVDLCQDGRAAVIDHVRRKYGQVAQIITFGTLKARAAIRDVCRVFGVNLAIADRLAKKVPEQLNITLDEAIEKEPDLRAIVEGKPEALEAINDKVAREQRLDSATARAVIEHARGLEGQARHAGVHAAGVIVATRPLREIVPLYRPSQSEGDEVVTQWDGPTCEKMGLLKMDFLGLRTISVIERAKKLIREGLGEEAIWAAVGREEEHRRSSRADGSARAPSSHPLDLDRLSYDDQRVFDLFRLGETTGVFQFESAGMRRLLMEMKPDRLEDLIAANALFRPGPMDLIPDYNRRKHGQAPVPRVHEIVDGFTRETYGVMVYQEQVMQIVHGLGGISLRDAYTLIKNISKKKFDKIEKERPRFLEGAQRQGLTQAQADDLFELILKFAGYGFNKSHSTGYAIVAYQTAYLKTYFPNQYMAAFLSYESGASKVSEWIPYLEDCRKARFIDPGTGVVARTGIEVRPPDVNLSRADFAVVFEPDEPRDALHGHIRFGLSAIRGAGDKAIQAILRERDGGEGAPARAFTSLFDFCERIPTGVVNRATIQALIKAGAMDSLHGRHLRSAMEAGVESAVNAGARLAADRASGQGALFGEAGPEAGPGPQKLQPVPAWSEAELLANEKAALGFYVSSHPLESWSEWASLFTSATAADIAARSQDSKVVLAALVQSVRTMVVKSGASAGQKMAAVVFEDLSGSIEAVLFSDRYASYAHLIQQDAALFVLGKVDLSRGTPQLVADRLVPIDGVPLGPGRLAISIVPDRLGGDSRETLAGVREALVGRPPRPPGVFPVELVVHTPRGAVVMQPESVLKVDPTPAIVGRVNEILGAGSVRVIGGAWIEPRNGTPRNRFAGAGRGARE